MILVVTPVVETVNLRKTYMLKRIERR